ncbi:MAG: hypothetical protein EAX96_03325 [Candidatus Lokiarchaeota archaeon]|nr:hypothetical protein [Candidatus Lokiarchaeota archaeon]
MLAYEKSNPFKKLLKKVSLYDLKCHLKQNKQFLKELNEVSYTTEGERLFLSILMFEVESTLQLVEQEIEERLKA